MKKYLLAALLMLLSVTGLQAQVTTSSINGSVTDASGEPLIGATVKATHQPSGTVYGTATNVEGRFNIQNMRVGGPYVVEVSYIGFQPKTYSDITLRLGVPYQLEATLSESGTDLQEVVVTADQSSIFNANKTGAATNVTTEQINTLPTISRSVTDFTRLTPQANGNGFAGRDARYNNLQIDGANFNNAFGLSSNALPGGSSQPISLDAIEQIQVNIAPYDVRQSGFTGAGINAVTRSGTNTFSGSAYTFYRNENFNGTKIGDQELPEQAANETKTFGARLGGPIIKNKLFFFANYEQEEETFPGITWVASRPGLTGPNVARTTATDLELVRDYLINNYDYNPGAYENYANEFANESKKFLVRLDWNITDKHTFTIRYNQVEGTSDQVVNNNSGPNPRSSSSRVSSNAIAFENANYSFKNVVRSLTAELNSSLSDKLSNQFLATFSRIQDTRTTPAEDFPFVDIWQDGDQYISFGTELFSKGNEVLNDNYSFTNNLTYLAGKHTFTGGASFELLKFGNSYQRMATSYYRYASVNDFLTDAQPLSFGITYPYEGQDPVARVNFATAGLYAQDKITFNEQLDLTVGLRAELPLYLNELTANPSIDALVLSDTDGNPTTYSSGEWPKSRLMLSPRIGFNYDAFGDGTLQLRGGTGIFSGRIPFVWLTNMPTNAGVIQNTLEPVPDEALEGIRFNPDPMYWVNNGPSDVFIKSPSGGAPGTFALVDRNFKMPQVWRSSIAADYTIPSTPLVATVDLLYTKDIQGVYQFNANRIEATQQLNYAGDNRDFWNGRNNTQYNEDLSGTATVLSNTSKGNSLALTGGLTLNAQDGFYGSVFYTYTRARDVTGNPGSSAGSAWSNNYSINDPNELLLGISQFETPHRVVANLSYRKEYISHLATTVSLFYEGANQGRFAYTYSGDINADGVSNDLLYIPQNSEDLDFAPIMSDGNVLFTPEQQREAFDRFVNNVDALKDSRGGYVERNSGLLPWFNRFDLRLLQDVFANVGKTRNTLQFSVDVKNFANLLSSDWGVYDELNNGSLYNYGLLRVTDVSEAGVPTFQMTTIRNTSGETLLPETPFRNRFSTSSTWSMQLGLRYIFN
ncbi:TonB-dependent receptor [Pontibacter russatus]|uniref:TonB-dependent receptor n=1 Tax=Pontibacter russatus TaxID=2694929 RepID=UPI001379A8E3|nr:TonB-dependent receptor [Pontibacter russatus]